VDYSNTCSSYFSGKGFTGAVAALLMPNCSSVGTIYVKPTTICGSQVVAGQADFPLASTLLGYFPVPGLGPQVSCSNIKYKKMNKRIIRSSKEKLEYCFVYIIKLCLTLFLLSPFCLCLCVSSIFLSILTF
jgi:hypothetical protein